MSIPTKVNWQPLDLKTKKGYVIMITFIQTKCEPIAKILEYFMFIKLLFSAI